MKKVLVLGVGNIICKDEGLGVHAVKELMNEYDFPNNVELMDGGTLGVSLMGKLTDCDLLIVVDAVLGGHEPGSVYHLINNDLRKSKAFRDSMHQTDLVDTLLLCELAGKRPECIVIGMEPYNWQDLGSELSPKIKERLPLLKQMIIEELNTQKIKVVKR
ncbi:HyaD/HybD family hydrogenase maturation endopeptidase [Desulfovibrio litoralis]|uniref:Hydrogenase maturation protease n=1 Tax=Desulfovibrio litoralis DSM 11393 TaxID=1121455 RepID=A0A1M7SW18_9BACT|nr:HyaD/HybD family hydrogenase maturation endopeptidase [Desulfovibrio litoralis]SHN62705.1 hydrogenase maturation protease [Desulfovibrio litoralis DSM 11393]